MQTPQQINVEELKLELLRRKTTRQVFKWNLSSQEAFSVISAAYMAEVEYRKRTFTADERLKEVFWQVANFITNPQSKFGMMFCGTCGNGKTTLLYALRSATNYMNEARMFENNKTRLVIYDAKEVSRIVKNPTEYAELCKTPILALEDIGREAVEVLEYGNVLNPIVDLLEYRYNEQLPTFITTNLTAKEIREKYGNRLADRFNEMIEVVIFKDGSYRRNPSEIKMS